MSNLNLYIKIFFERFFTVFRGMTENVITLYIASDYNMHFAHNLSIVCRNYCDFRRIIKIRIQNLIQIAKTIPDLTKNVHIVKDDKGIKN